MLALGICRAERVKVSLQQGSEDGVESGMVRIRVAPAFFNNAAEVKQFLKVSEQLITA